MPKPTTTQRGYGWNHQVARKAALRALSQGAPCPFCALGMYRDQELDYDHVVPLSMGGNPHGPKRLSHSSCNRRAGAHLRWGTRTGSRARARRPGLLPDPGPNPEW